MHREMVNRFCPSCFLGVVNLKFTRGDNNKYMLCPCSEGKDETIKNPKTLVEK